MDETDMSKRYSAARRIMSRKKKDGKLAGGRCNLVCFQKGCGTSVFRGPMAEALMNGGDKRKAKSGVKRIESTTGFVFARK